MIFKNLLLVIFAAVFVGCNTFTPSQTNNFIDEEGLLITVQYGQLKKPQKTEFTSPINGKKVETISRLAVEVILPNGRSFTGYKCLNMLPTGTMYMSSDGKWLYHANGTSCSVYLINQDKNDYFHVFNGVLSEGSMRNSK